MVMTLEEFKARIAQPEGPLLKPKRVPSSGHDATCHLRETGRYTAKCECCKALRRRTLRRRKAKRASERRAAAKPVQHCKPERLRHSESVFTVSGGLPSLGKGSR